MVGTELPDIAPSERLVDLWVKAGRSATGINGAEPFTYLEVQAFNVMTGAELSPVEAECLVDMSRRFVEEIGEDNPLRIAPMEREYG